MRFLFVILVAVSVFCTGYAKKYTVLGRLFDVQTEQRLGDGKLTIVNPETGDVYGQTTDKFWGKENWFMLDFFVGGKDSVNLLLKIEQPGYKPKALPLNIGRNFPTRMEITEPIWLISDTASVSAEMYRELKEVSVVSTRIKMVVRGDTLVYDAAAFRLSEGSMLDALVNQLPGVTLDSYGKISVNGRFVNSLLIDGKDFFSGDPNIALKNLPAYIVKNIKVYDRNELYNSKAPTQSKNEDLVMDVILKKQYQKGFLANLEGGYGTGNKYQGKFFALEYAKNGRIAAFANINNINNDSRGPGLWDENWRDQRINEGNRRILKAGTDWTWTLKNEVDTSGMRVKHLAIDGTATYTLEHKDLNEIISSTQFLPEANRYGRSMSIMHNRNEQFFSRLYIGSTLRRNLFVALAPAFVYQSGRFTTNAIGADFAVNPSESSRGEALDSVKESITDHYATENLLIYRQNHNGFDSQKTVGTYGNLNISIGNGMLYGKQLNVYFDWDYNNLTNQGQNNRLIDYRTNPSLNFHQSLFTSSPGYNLSLTPSVRLIKRFEYNNVNTELTFRYASAYKKDRGEQAAYRLSEPDEPIEEAMRDITNSFFSLLTQNNNTLIGEAHISNMLCDDWTFDAKINQNITYMHRNLHYQRAVIDTALTHNTMLYTPDITLSFVNESMTVNKYDVRFKAENTPVNMTRLFNTLDNVDPMNVYVGNPDLRSSTTYFGSLRYEQRQNLTERLFSTGISYYSYANRVGQMKFYDNISGVSTYMPINVTGSYRLNGSLDFTTPFPTKTKRFWFTTSTKCDYLHNPDYVGTTSLADATKETIHNFSLNQDFRFKWGIAPGYSLGINISAAWYRATSSREDFTSINALDLHPGLVANLRLPGNIDLSTDFSCTRRFGYEDSALNTTDWTWNLKIERAWLKGKLTTRIDAYDILNSINNVNVRINSLGRTETWTNSMSRYVLFSLAWRFTVMPKK